MKVRIQFKKTSPKEYTSNGCNLVCRGIVVRTLPTAKLAKLAAERWNHKHQQSLQNEDNNS